MFVVDDDFDIRKMLCSLAKSVGIRVETYSSAQEFLEAYDRKRPGCVLLDVCMPGMNGIELQQQLASQIPGPTIVFLTGKGDLPSAIHAMRTGAVDYLQKPFIAQILIDRIHEAFVRDRENRRVHSEFQELEVRRARLTAREREVMVLITSGQTTKGIASRLGISPKTVDKHRAKVLEKMDVDNPIELIQLLLNNNSQTSALGQVQDRYKAAARGSERRSKGICVPSAFSNASNGMGLCK